MIGGQYRVPEVITGIAVRRTTQDAEGTEGWCGGRPCVLRLTPPILGSLLTAPSASSSCVDFGQQS
jgi:hypothetical protein